MDRVAPGYRNRIMSAEEAAQFVRSGMTLGMSGFTGVGYPKAVPKALAQAQSADSLTVCIGASAGDDLDGVMARAGIIKTRYAYQSNADLRRAINSGSVGYSDMHLSHFPMFVNRHTGPHIDIAIVECAAITEEGLIPTASIGSMDAVVRAADQVIVEVNGSVPTEIMGMHDIFEVGIPPNAEPVCIRHPVDRIGKPYVFCEPEKIAAVVLTDMEDQAPKFKPPGAATEQIGANIIRFLKDEVKAGRLPKNLAPIQSGVGSVGNAVLQSLGSSDFRGLTMYTEVMQTSALKLLDEGVFSHISTCAVSLDAETRRRFYENIAAYKDRIVIRPQEISNHPEVIRRLGVLAINTPIEVDIYGNVNSSHVMGSRIMNGIGGSGDFTRNAGISIFATESLAKDGRISCIVPMVSHVDHTEHDVHVVVTEQGLADLRWKTPTERAELLIENCAHPSYRPLLRDYFERAGKEAPGKHTPHILSEAFSWHTRYLQTGSMR